MRCGRVSLSYLMCFDSVRVVCVSSSYYHMCVHHVHVTVCLFFRSHVFNTLCVSSSAPCCASCVCFFFSCVFLKCMSRGRPPPITWPPLSLLSASGSQLFSIWAVSSTILLGSNVSIALLERPKLSLNKRQLWWYSIAGAPHPSIPHTFIAQMLPQCHSYFASIATKCIGCIHVAWHQGQEDGSV